MTRARIGQSRPSVQMWMLVVGSFLAQVASFSSSSTSPKFQVDPTLQPTYQYARTVRVVEGHDAATEYYQQILQQNPLDRTAATHIAACPETPQIQEQMLDASTHEIRQLRKLLQKVDFTTSAIADLVLSKEASENLFSVAPLFLNPLPAGAKVPPLPTCQRSCLIQLFLLSVCIPLSTWKDLLFTVADLELLSAIGIVTIDRDTELIVPHCHIMPVELPPALGESHHKSLFVLTVSIRTHIQLVHMKMLLRITHTIDSHPLMHDSSGFASSCPFNNPRRPEGPFPHRRDARCSHVYWT